VRGRLIAGEAGGLRAGVKTFSPLFYLDWDMDAGAVQTLDAAHRERAVYVASGTAEVDGQVLRAGQMAVLEPGLDVRVTALTPARVMALGGEPLGQRFMFWNFVSSSKDRLEQAKEDWRQQRMKLPVGDDRTFIPLPETP
jgi:redox-sensitive bicupin YhaK (pirin superfamily)